MNIQQRYRALTWLQRYRLSQCFSRSLWTLPVFGMVTALGVYWSLHFIEVILGLEAQVDPATALTLLGTLASSMFTFIVFVGSSLLIAVQLASAQLTPRIIGLVLHHGVTKLALTLFVFTFTFTLAALARVSGNTPMITAYFAVYSCLASLCVFLYLVSSVCRVLQPNGALGLASRRARVLVERVYPRLISASSAVPMAPARLPDEEPRLIIPNPHEGVVQGFDMQGLVEIARRTDCVIEVTPQVGQFVAAGEPLFRIFGKGTMPEPAALYHSIALGPERTLQQDPTFVFRIMVDIASKGLSRAINDPTTAVLAIDQIQHLLRIVGSRHLDEGQRCDERGTVRLVYWTPDWEDFVSLSVTEIRHFGSTSIQVVRRLRAMLDHLIQTLPEERLPVLRQEMELLNRTAEHTFTDPHDRAMARLSDSQGMSGKHVFYTSSPSSTAASSALSAR